MRFVLFSKTPWTEAPRLRHQLTRLLTGAGHEVIFFQRPVFPWQKRSGVFRPEPGVTVAQHRELLHHKLRVSRALQRLNAAWVLRDVKQVSSSLDLNAEDVVVNFNYDYDFLRTLFPTNRIITVINDDFTSTALPGSEAVLVRALERTCAMSDRVLTVSEPLREQLSGFCEPELFQPWADREYAPPAGANRHVLLYWGFISARLNFEMIDALLAAIERRNLGLRVLFVGPVHGRQSLPERISSSPHVDVRASATLDELPLHEVLAGLIPYRSGTRDLDAITLPNKALQFLARGIPLLVSGMPHFIRAPFVTRLDEGPTDEALRRLRQDFASVQPAIRAFVDRNSAASRLGQFLTLADGGSARPAPSSSDARR